MDGAEVDDGVGAEEGLSRKQKKKLRERAKKKAQQQQGQQDQDPDQQSPDDPPPAAAAAAATAGAKAGAASHVTGSGVEEGATSGLMHGYEDDFGTSSSGAAGVRPPPPPAAEGGSSHGSALNRSKGGGGGEGTGGAVSSSSSAAEAAAELTPIEYVDYIDERQLPAIMELVDHDLSEPYSIFTYRYFLCNWPGLCMVAMMGDETVGVIICKAEDEPESAAREELVHRGSELPALPRPAPLSPAYTPSLSPSPSPYAVFAVTSRCLRLIRSAASGASAQVSLKRPSSE